MKKVKQVRRMLDWMHEESLKDKKKYVWNVNDFFYDKDWKEKVPPKWLAQGEKHAIKKYQSLTQKLEEMFIHLYNFHYVKNNIYEQAYSQDEYSGIFEASLCIKRNDYIIELTLLESYDSDFVIKILRAPNSYCLEWQEFVELSSKPTVEQAEWYYQSLIKNTKDSEIQNLLIKNKEKCLQILNEFSTHENFYTKLNYGNIKEKLS